MKEKYYAILEANNRLLEMLKEIDHLPKTHAENYYNQCLQKKNLLTMPIINLFCIGKVKRLMEEFRPGIQSNNEHFVTKHQFVTKKIDINGLLKFAF